MKATVGTLALWLCALPAFGSQSAGSLSSPQDKPQKKAPPAKIYTNEDLRRTKGQVSVPGEPTPPGDDKEAKKDETAGRPAGQPEKTEEELRAERAAALQQEMKALVDRSAAIRNAMDTAQLELNDLSNYTFGGRRSSVMQFLTDAKTEMDKIGQAMAALEEKARRDGTTVSRP